MKSNSKRKAGRRLGAAPLLGINPQQVKELKRIRSESQKLLYELETLMLKISAARGGHVPQGLVNALTFGKHLPLWIGMTIDD